MARMTEIGGTSADVSGIPQSPGATSLVSRLELEKVTIKLKALYYFIPTPLRISFILSHYI